MTEHLKTCYECGKERYLDAYDLCEACAKECGLK